jgi:hypothetical protein
MYWGKQPMLANKRARHSLKASPDNGDLALDTHDP